MAYEWNTHSVYKYDDTMDEISGFGGGYEETCRFMVKVGLEFWDSHKKFDPMFEGMRGVYGILSTNNNDAKLLSDHILKSVTDYFGSENSPSGAMHQAAISHIIFIKKNSWDEYKKRMAKNK